jgi:transcriptional regulator with XRE-family HTH domain
MDSNKNISNESLKKLLGRKLEQLRQNSNQTIEATALDLGLNFSEYYRLLKGKRLPHLRTLLNINTKYGISMDWWFSDLEIKMPSKISQKAEELLLLSNYHKLDTMAKEVVQDMLKNLAKNRRKKHLPTARTFAH